MLIRCVLSSFSKPYSICIRRSIHPESTEACGRRLIYNVVALESTEGFILAGKWDQSCNYSPLAGMPLSGLSYIRNRPSFLKLSKGRGRLFLLLSVSHPYNYRVLKGFAFIFSNQERRNRPLICNKSILLPSFSSLNQTD